MSHLSCRDPQVYWSTYRSLTEIIPNGGAVYILNPSWLNASVQFENPQIYFKPRRMTVDSIHCRLHLDYLQGQSEAVTVRLTIVRNPHHYNPTYPFEPNYVYDQIFTDDNPIGNWRDNLGLELVDVLWDKTITLNKPSTNKLIVKIAGVDQIQDCSPSYHHFETVTLPNLNDLVAMKLNPPPNPFSIVSCQGNQYYLCVTQYPQAQTSTGEPKQQYVVKVNWSMKAKFCWTADDPRQ